MNFKNQGRPLSGDGMGNVSATLGVSAPAVWAVLSVETKGFGFLLDRRPQILFERHKFCKLTNGIYDATYPDISNAEAGGYSKTGAGEYTRLEKAMALNQEAALQSASWGIGQIMGFNFKMAGFANVNDMVAAMVNDENAQLLAMASFIKSNHLDKTLQSQDWASFARGYNGTDYKKNNYDTKLEAAHENYTKRLPDLRLRTAQTALLYLGYNPGTIDGLLGKNTTAAIQQFQQKSGLPVTGALDNNTESTLLAKAFPA